MPVGFFFLFYERPSRWKKKGKEGKPVGQEEMVLGAEEGFLEGSKFEEMFQQ